jgi:hypothetical protein
VRKDAIVRRCLFSALFAVLLAPGCVMVQIGVTNPIPGLTTVAVAPFLNLSSERAVDGRRFALAYASELQKVPGFEVIPVGVTEVAMIDAKLDLNDVDDVLKLAKTLRVDAVVVGALTEYSPYYPPRIGMAVNWYSPKAWSFYPGIQIEPQQRAQLQEWDHERIQQWRDYHKQLDEQCAPETPFWIRAYHCFQRWPVIRNLYGDPSLVRLDYPTPLIYRAQSPDATQPPNLEGPYQAAANQPQTAGDDIQTLVKIPHYQEPQAAPEIIRVVMTPDDRDSRIPEDDSDSPLPLAKPSPPAGAMPTAPPPAPIPANGPNSGLPAPPEVGEPAPFPGGPPLPSAPVQRTPMGLPMDEMPFGPEGPALKPVPLSPVPANPEFDQPATDAGPPKPAVRDPALAPCPPQPNPFNVPQPIQPWQSNPRLPLMSYTRVFDGADGDLCAALRDYVELNGDLRSGGWEAYLHRSDDFIRFTSYRMILEMLSLHGGEGKHRMIFKFRKYTGPLP